MHDDVHAGNGAQAQREVDRLLAEFGDQVGIAGLALDAAGYYCLSFDGEVLNLRYDERREDICVYARVGDLPANAEPAYCAHLFQAGYASVLSGAGMLAVDNEHNAVVWLDRIVPRGMTELMFQQALETAVDQVEFWKRSLREGTFQRQGTSHVTSQVTPPVEAEPPADDYFVLRG
jgi:hypothetical protein